MFESARIKLTFWYLVIIMAISIIFSVAIYRVQVEEAARILQRQRITIFRDLLPSGQRIVDPQILVDAENHLKSNLILMNIIILVLSGGAAYFLAGRTLKPIEEMVEDQKRFVADASHELRTPLTAMQTELEVNLRNRNLSKESKQILQSNLEEVEKLNYLSDKLLKLSRFEQNGEFSLTKINLNQILEKSINKVLVQAKNKKIEIVKELDPVEIEGEEDSLYEAFGTILDNAVKYSPNGNRVEVKLKTRNQNGVVTIKDFGIGIKESAIPFIFNRFYRGENSRAKEKVDGFGLGLSIAQKIITRHKGKIEVKSRIGSGTTFTIFLPK